jgi:hypothetical protein
MALPVTCSLADDAINQWPRLKTLCDAPSWRQWPPMSAGEMIRSHVPLAQKMGPVNDLLPSRARPEDHCATSPSGFRPEGWQER